MMFINDTPTAPVTRVTSPYRVKLMRILAATKHDVAAAELLESVARNVETGAYGIARMLYRQLPIEHRELVGAPPTTVTEDR